MALKCLIRLGCLVQRLTVYTVANLQTSVRTRVKLKGHTRVIGVASAHLPEHQPQGVDVGQLVGLEVLQIHGPGQKLRRPVPPGAVSVLERGRQVDTVITARVFDHGFSEIADTACEVVLHQNALAGEAPVSHCLLHLPTEHLQVQMSQPTAGGYCHL